MSKATKRKHVTREVLDEFVLPEEHQQIVQVVAPRGNNLHEVKMPSGDKFLASMPTKFRKNVWIKRGDFVIVDPIEEGDKVKGEIIVILFPKQIKFIQKEGFWPEEFLKGDKESEDSNIIQIADKLEKATLKQKGNNEYSDSDSEEDDNDDDLFINTNRPPVIYYSSEESSSEEEEENEEASSPRTDEDDESSVDH
ncbi:probable RNA-binding protein EIF1AD [Amphiura filiformis]|uniref:probable RNA-binding protein EIF1AD n=1 Tax=Amphiura filiformis TaxID=82378 RepID=UPI003B2102A8